MEKKKTTLHTFILFTVPLIALLICVVITAIKFITLSLDFTAWLIATFACIVLWGVGSKLDDYCCPECGGWFCMTKTDESVVGKKEVTIKETRKVQKYSGYKKQYGEFETYTVDVPGVEYRMNISYHCKKCNSNVKTQATKRYKH